MNEDIIDLVYERIAAVVPEGTNKGEALRAALRFAADCIHQIDKEDDNLVLEASINILKCEFRIFQNKFGETNLKEHFTRPIVLARGHHIRNADGTITDVSNDPNYECKQ